MKKIRLLSLITYTVVVATLAVTTFLSPSVYGTVWFFALWFLFAAALIAAVSLSGMWRHAGRMILHLSFLAMLGGGLLTWLTQKTGTLKLNTGETKIAFVADDGQEFILPKSVKLDRFEVEYYPGGVVPRDYISHLIVSGKPETVSMNKILDLDGYRLLQSSYDSSGATVLSVNHDPYGITLSYAGYLLFAIGGIMLLAAPKGEFRKLLRTLGVAFFVISAANSAGAAPVDGVPRATADSLRSRAVMYQGKVVCFNTLARDVVKKLYGKPTYRGLTPEQTLLSLRLFPGEWKRQPIIRIKDKKIRESLGINTQYASLSQLFDSLGNYRVPRLYATLGEKKKRAVEELDEKVGIILSLYSGDLIVTPPSGTEPLSPVRINAELAYNATPFTLIISVLLLCGFVAGMLNFLRLPKGLKLARMLLVASFAASLCCLSMQWYLSGRLPLANTFETLQFVVLVMQMLIICAARRDTLLLPLGMLVTGALAFVIHLMEMNPVVTPLMPVLHSGWLSLHVSLVMTAYAILCFTFVVSSTALLLRSSAERLQKLSLALLYPGVFLLGLGIFTGAVWANVSWGQYWSWDPKETWALVTMLIYALPLHKGIPFLRNPRNFHTYLLLAILSVAMTYFGVNHLNSLHAYN